jgi:alpha-L-arabinofuranosidase
VAAAKTKDGGAITIGVANPQAKPQAMRLTFDGVKPASSATVWRIAGNDPAATNSPDKPKVAITEETHVPFGETITVPAYSVNVYRVAIQ